MESSRLKWETPLDKTEVDYCISKGLFQEDTPELIKSFLMNMEGWLLDEMDKLTIDQDIEDLGIKASSFENGARVSFNNDYRCFLINHIETKPVICLGLLAYAKEKDIRSSLLLIGVEESTSKQSDLQLDISDSLIINEDCVEVFHDGAIGSEGVANSAELLEYIEERIPSLVQGDKILLGTFNVYGEINSKNIDLTEFVLNVINYVLIRKDYRESLIG